jgi:signal transduction histidine kinase
VQDRQFRLTAANRRFKEDFDVEQGAFCHEVYKHRAEPCPNCPVVKTFEDGQSHQSEMVVTARSGERYNVLIWTAPLRNADGEVTHVMEMSTNITQIRKLQDHLSSLGLKISSISHGIKGLLTGLDGGIYLVDSGFAKDRPERVQAGWADVKTVVDRIRKLVHNILFFAKERELKRSHIDGLTFAEDVAATVEARIKTNDIDLIRDFDETVGTLHIDAGVIRLSLINILENALDACLEDQADEKHQIVFRVRQSTRQVVFEIQDNGIGMDQETIENLFTLFFSSKGNKGTGLGLFIADKVIDQHGGRINVESKPGQGSTFKISIPKMKPKSAKSREKKE